MAKKKIPDVVRTPILENGGGEWESKDGKFWFCGDPVDRIFRLPRTVNAMFTTP